jgi:membrane-associated protease RseP (regulator of RpoE activity)
MILTSLAFIATLAAAGVPASRPASVPATQAGLVVDNRDFDRLIADLDDPRFAARERATRRLCDLAPSFLPRLAAKYRAVGSEESRHRLRYALETIFYQQELTGRSGFIGIRLWPTTLTDVIDPVDGRKCQGIRVLGVIEGLPAERAGVRDLDIIFGLNDQPLPASPSTQQFISQVAATPPGSSVRLRLLRPEQTPRRVTLQPAEDKASPTLGLKLSPPPVGSRLGIRVIEVAPDSPADTAGIKVNDTIVAVNGISLLSDLDGPTILTQVLQAAKPASPVHLSVQSGKELTLQVVVGRRSLEYLNPEEKPAMEAKFARWWRQQGGQWQPASGPIQPPVPFRSQIPNPADQPPQDRSPIIP